MKKIVHLTTIGALLLLGACAETPMTAELSAKAAQIRKAPNGTIIRFRGHLYIVGKYTRESGRLFDGCESRFETTYHFARASFLQDVEEIATPDAPIWSELKRQCEDVRQGKYSPN